MRHMEIIVLGAALSFASGNLMAEENILVQETKHLLENVKMRLPDAEHWDASGYMENHLTWRASPEFAQLEKTVHENWETVLKNIQDIAPSDTHQVILFTSFCSLPLKASFQSLNKIADLCLSNAISKEMFEWTSVAYEVYTVPTYRLSFHYKDPVVAEVLRKATIINPELKWYRDMASGKAKRELEHPLHYDTDTGEEPNITSVKSWVVFLGRMLARVAAVGVAVLGAIMAWRCFWRKKKQA